MSRKRKQSSKNNNNNQPPTKKPRIEKRFLTIDQIVSAQKEHSKGHPRELDIESIKYLLISKLS